MKHLGEVGEICCARYKAGDMDVQATLLVRAYGVGHCYQIMLEQEGECARCDLGDALEPAKKLFFDIVFGGVTACTLADIVEDRMGTLF